MAVSHGRLTAVRAQQRTSAYGSTRGGRLSSRLRPPLTSLGVGPTVAPRLIPYHGDLLVLGRMDASTGPNPCDTSKTAASATHSRGSFMIPVGMLSDLIPIGINFETFCLRSHSYRNFL